MAKPLPPAWVPWQRELRDAPLDVTTKAVGWCLSTYMDGAGRAQVARSTLARCCGVSLSTVKRAIRRLVRVGMLAVDHGGGADVNRYQLRSTGGWPAPPPGPPAPPLEGSPVALGGVTNGPPPGPPMDHERKGLETYAGAPAPAPANGPAPDGWVPEDDAAIAEEFAARARAKVHVRGEGFGDPDVARFNAEQAAAARRRILRGET